MKETLQRDCNKYYFARWRRQGLKYAVAANLWDMTMKPWVQDGGLGEQTQNAAGMQHESMVKWIISLQCHNPKHVYAGESVKEVYGPGLYMFMMSA